ncbi:response regulator [Larkinella terrae]|uniref:Response regulator n=1 Tax=Larkinella terrae TaxID=2025311 RepID=A0A7K0EJM8_9BACT|nr:response regulator [Larkinella terrae]MRS61942.1 response regulator [Larkinella terrae]
MQLKNNLIFIVDDDDDDRFMLWQAFQKKHPGCLVFTFTDGQELLDHLSEYYDTPDLIILDQNMPVMDGFTTLKRLKGSSRLRSIPTVILGSSFETNDNCRGHELGADALLTKPTRYSELVQLANQMFSASA